MMSSAMKCYLLVQSLRATFAGNATRCKEPSHFAAIFVQHRAETIGRAWKRRTAGRLMSPTSTMQTPLCQAANKFFCSASLKAATRAENDNIEQCRNACWSRTECHGISFNVGNCELWSTYCDVAAQPSGNYWLESKACMALSLEQAPPPPGLLAPVQASYIFADENTNSCPMGSQAIADEAACKAATATLRTTFGYAQNNTRWPKGCFKGLGRLWFNTHATGVPHAGYSPICKQDLMTEMVSADDSREEDSKTFSAITHGMAGTNDSTVPITLRQRRRATDAKPIAHSIGALELMMGKSTRHEKAVESSARNISGLLAGSVHKSRHYDIDTDLLSISPGHGLILYVLPMLVICGSGVVLILNYCSARTSDDAHVVPSSKLSNLSGRPSQSSLNILWFCSAAFSSFAYSAVIPSSYDLAELIGRGSAFSGLIISICPACSAVGVLITRVMATKRILNYRALSIVGTFCMGVSVVLYWVCGISGLPTSSLVVLSRCMLGLASGVSAFARIDMKFRILDPGQVDTATLFDNIGSGCGLSLGPLLSSLMIHVIQWRCSDTLMMLTTSASLITTIFTVPLCALQIFLIPSDVHTATKVRSSVTHGRDAEATEHVVTRMSGERWQETRDKAILSGLVLICCGQVLSQSVEVGTALLLETTFQWRIWDVGVAVGTTILLSIPLIGLTGFWIGNSTDMCMKLQRLEQGLTMACLSCFLFVPTQFAQYWKWLPIIIADWLVFGIGAGCSANVQSAIYLLADDDDGKWSPGNMILALEVPFLGRGCVGPVVRALLSCNSTMISGQMAYALAQIMVASVALIVIVFFFRPSVKTCHDLLVEEPHYPGQGISPWQLFDFYRVKPEASALAWTLFAIWVPIGIALATLRFIMIVPWWLLYAVFHKVGAGRIYMSCALPLMGLWVRVRGQANLANSHARLICGNHVSDFDPFAMCAAYPLAELLYVANNHWRVVASYFKQWFGVPVEAIWVKDGESKKAIADELRREGTKEPKRKILIFPEGATTNGKGVLRWNPFIFSLEQPVLPYAIEYCNPWPIVIDIHGTSVVNNMVAMFFLPVVVYTITFLPQAQLAEGEVAKQFANRVSRSVAEELGIPLTTFSRKELEEVKRQRLQWSQA